MPLLRFLWGALLHKPWETQICFKVNVWFLCWLAFKKLQRLWTDQTWQNPTWTKSLAQYFPKWFSDFKFCNYRRYNTPAGQIGDNMPILAGCSDRGHWALQWRQQPLSSCLWGEGSCPWVEGPHTNLVLASDANMIGSPLRLWSNKSSAPLSSCSPLLSLSLVPIVPFLK